MRIAYIEFVLFRIAEAETMVREERQRANERLREVEQQTAARIQESERR